MPGMRRKAEGLFQGGLRIPAAVQNQAYRSSMGIPTDKRHNNPGYKLSKSDNQGEASASI
jgi:hypothetical protein